MFTIIKFKYLELLMFFYDIQITHFFIKIFYFQNGSQIMKELRILNSRLQATNGSVRLEVSIEQSQGYQTVSCLIGY